MSAAVIAAGAQQASRNRVVRQFRDAGALSAETAIRFSPERRMDLRAFDRLVGDSALIAALEGRFWLDEAALARADRRRRAQAMRAVAILASLTAIVAAAIVLFTRHA